MPILAGASAFNNYLAKLFRRRREAPLIVIVVHIVKQRLCTYIAELLIDRASAACGNWDVL